MTSLTPRVLRARDSGLEAYGLQGYLAHKKPPTPRREKMRDEEMKATML